MFIKKTHNIGISLYSFISKNKANHCQVANHCTLYPIAIELSMSAKHFPWPKLKSALNEVFRSF